MPSIQFMYRDARNYRKRILGIDATDNEVDVMSHCRQCTRKPELSQGNARYRIKRRYNA